MFRRHGSIIEPILSLCLFVLGASYFTVLVTIYLKSWQQGEEIVGIVQSAYFAGLLIGGIMVERLIMRTGHIRSFATFSSILTVSILLMGAFHQVWSWFLLRLIFGFSMAAMYVVVESWLLSCSSQANRGTILSFYMVALYLTQALSQALLHYLGEMDSKVFMIGASLTSLSIIPLAIGFNQAPVIENGVKLSIKRLIKAAPLGVVACIVGGIIQGGVYASIPSFALACNYSAPLLSAVAILGGGILQWPLGKLSDLFDRRKVLFHVSVALMVPCVLMPFINAYESMVVIICFLIGGLSFALYPIGISHVCDRLNSTEVTGATAWLLTAYGVGSVLGPLIASQFFQITPVAIFIFYALCSIALAYLAFRSTRICPLAPMEEKGPFVPQTSTTLTISELNPRIFSNEAQTQEHNSSSREA